MTTLQERMEDAVQEPRPAAVVQQVIEPDVQDSGIPAELDVPAHRAWSNLMADVQWIGKNRKTESGTRFNFRGIDDVIEAVAPALRKHGVIMVPTRTEPTWTVIETKSGAAMNYCRAVVTFTVIGPRGDTLPVPIQSFGECFDSGDKSGSKAFSVAVRNAYLHALAIPVKAPQMDPENGQQHEIAGTPRPSAAQYAAEIQSPETSIQRLLQIKAELTADPVKARAEVETLGGTAVGLWSLLSQVGQERERGKA